MMLVTQVYCPYLLISKKRYAGLLYTNPDKPDKMDSKVCRISSQYFPSTAFSPDKVANAAASDDHVVMFVRSEMPGMALRGHYYLSSEGFYHQSILVMRCRY